MGREQELIRAVQEGRRDVVENLLAESPEWVNVRDAQGVSVVMLALYYREPEIARLLVERGAAVGIFEAAAMGDLPAARRWIEADAGQVNAFSPDGFQPLGLACFFGHDRLAAYLVAQGAEVNTPSRNPMKVMPLHSAAAAGDLEIVRLLLDHGADVHARQADDFTALHAAGQNGHVEMIRLLLEHGADADAQTRGGQTALSLALQHGREAAAGLLRGGR